MSAQEHTEATRKRLPAMRLGGCSHHESRMHAALRFRSLDKEMYVSTVPKSMLELKILSQSDSIYPAPYQCVGKGTFSSIHCLLVPGDSHVEFVCTCAVTDYASI
jgi:hypothetical protein